MERRGAENLHELLKSNDRAYGVGFVLRSMTRRLPVVDYSSYYDKSNIKHCYNLQVPDTRLGLIVKLLKIRRQRMTVISSIAKRPTLRPPVTRRRFGSKHITCLVLP